MADTANIQDFNLNLTPHSVAVGNQRYLWITTSNRSVVRVNPNDPNSRRVIPTLNYDLTAGVMKDPVSENQRIWMASPDKVDPILMMETQGNFPITVYELEPRDGRAESIKLRTTDKGTEGKPNISYDLLFAEPIHNYVGILPIPAHGGTYAKMPVVHDTYLWDVAVATDPIDKKTHTYWATGQKRASNPTRTKNGVFRRSPGQTTWESVGILDGPEQKPFYIIADTEAVWFTATNPNQVIRWDIAEGLSTTVSLGDAVPQQLVFYTDDKVWVASSKGLHEIDRHQPSLESTIDLPHGKGAQGLCVGTNGELWYTSPGNKSFGKYVVPPPPYGGASLVGRTQVVYQGESVVHMKDHVQQPLIAEYISNGHPVPGIPLTCRIDADGATFDDGTRERVVLTDQLGRVAMPPVAAGLTEEVAILSIGLGNTEPHATTTLRITQD
ncbi:hypothetical protein K2224_38015 (plasmid) [Streptomyces sp. BHT-5-2]|uniref:hypothetical protein n=1 Tax=unclassified Streptomyces TaxID=2593676 RepID=UPI001C8DD5DE|nr:hypothetical protein [Streptomyces sp. BHT-5-2]QZL08825.1 hypothetical protein K2224_38015 [Streptomyces sp. BHT-5-2]